MPITLIQPRHSYADDVWQGHIHLSAPLLSVKARLQAAGITGIGYIDENVTPHPSYPQEGVVGINLIGSPYIPVVLDMIKRIPEQVNILLGGQIIWSLTPEEFDAIFRKNNPRHTIQNGNNPSILAETAGVSAEQIPPVEHVSLEKAYAEIPDGTLHLYLQNEFSVYVSQWCKYNCSFCQAAKWQPEIYRDLEWLSAELLFLATKAVGFWVPSLKFYMSNLDILQTPEKLSDFLDVIEHVQKTSGIKIYFRGLAWVESFMQCYNNHKELLQRAQKIGLTTIGYGIDGGTPEVWKSIGKVQNFRKISGNAHFDEQQKAIKTIEFTRELWIQPEILMVFWHPNETPESLKAAYNFCQDMHHQFWALPRPHVSKNVIPGARWWRDPRNAKLVRQFIDDPRLFQALDYTALASELSHEDENLRRQTNYWYEKICALDPGSTHVIVPDTPEFRSIAESRWLTVRQMNAWKFDR